MNKVKVLIYKKTGECWPVISINGDVVVVRIGIKAEYVFEINDEDWEFGYAQCYRN